MPRSGTFYRTCNLCEAMCGVAITLEEEQIIAIKGDENDPFSRGHICPKALALKDLYEDPDRLRKPMEKRDGQWHELEWEEALEAYQRALYLSPDDPSLLHETGVAWLERDEPERAREALERAMALDPDRTETRRLLRRLDRESPAETPRADAPLRTSAR